MPSDLDILLPPDEQEEPGGGHGHVIIPQGTAHLYKEPSNKARLAKLKQDILGDGVKESKLDKYASLYNVINTPMKVSESKSKLNKYYGGKEAVKTSLRLTEIPKADLMYLVNAIATLGASEFNSELEPGLVQLHKKLDLTPEIHIGRFNLKMDSISLIPSDDPLPSDAQIEFTISDSGEPSVTYDLEYGQLYMMFIGPIGSSAADLIIVNLGKTMTIVQPTSGSLNPNNITPYDIDNSDDGNQPIADDPIEEKAK